MVDIFVRILSVAAVFLLYKTFPKSDYFSFFVAILFAHYVLATYYSKKQIIKIATQKTFWPALAILFLIGSAAVYFKDIMFIPFICLHIALSEVYMSGESPCGGNKKFWEKINAIRLIFYLSAFIYILKDHPVFNNVVPAVFLFVPCGLFLLVFGLILKNSSQLSKTYLQIIIFDLTAIIIFFLILYLDIKLTQKELVLYHVTTWIVTPVIKFARGNNFSQTKQFILLNTIFIAFFYFIQQVTGTGLSASIPLWGSIHFIITFATSKLNPQIIAQYFYPPQST